MSYKNDHQDKIDFSKIYSYSKLELFDQCPKAYHFTYLDPVYSKMKGKLRKEPQNIWFFYTLGKAIHDALTLYFHLPKDQKTIKGLKEQLQISWRSEAMFSKLPPLGKWGGFKSIEEERSIYKEALQMLLNFKKGFNEKAKIYYLPTNNLNRSIEDYKKLIKPISKDYDISGKFDLILKEDSTLGNDKDSDSLVVVDFKTGKREESSIFQLKFYKLLGELNFKQLIKKASFYYLKTGRIKEFDLSKEDKNDIKNLVLEKIEKIKAEKKFKTKPSKLCQYCLFRQFCPAKEEIKKYIGPQEDQEDIIDDLPF
ncbi:hypothetical protein COT75_01015 [Candidatus Beckwithbacteria bacterium CG10_big_fil_rev_8_21_14_0_10_34_10]|uniref:PD-(D/E)XK endonuclease-like domain-containing protein n=1 Tax=Candidatus Beckwithbacteria bacterium CG10_big_fil_rev_8_21_14_0_10_34_10 TaxID=1974495 RepID=A0A2H0WA54_9BACT|nr:MAG: hypothetical protein COT75_01015 [Candidatus Beckwithbacteria bacterium CG10_big_fil_rev_8_21_14_0_10_34_10]